MMKTTHITTISFESPENQHKKLLSILRNPVITGDMQKMVSLLNKKGKLVNLV